MYNVETDLLLMAAFGLILILMGLVGTRKQRKTEPPRYMGYVKPERYRTIHGYSPVMRDWAPKLGTVVPRGGYGNE